MLHAMAQAEPTVSDSSIDTFEALQQRLGSALEVNKPGSGTPHVVIMLPSLGLGESFLSHYANRIPVLEHRYLVACLMLVRIPGCEVVFVASQDPGSEVLDYYLGFFAPDCRDDARRRFRVLALDDLAPRGVAAKLLDRPGLVESLRSSVQGRLAFIEPGWNVGENEAALARALGVPINGAAPELWPLGFKSAGRRLFAEAGVPVPVGVEDVRSVTEAVEVIEAIRRRRPDAAGVVLKHDDSGGGDGNAVVHFHGIPDAPADARRWIRQQIAALPGWYLHDLRAGSVVEELITGYCFSSPSVQVDILPDGDVVVVSSHEQLVGGNTGHVYTGCRFPADPAYAPDLARYGVAVGERLSRRGAVGRFSVDFAAAVDAAGIWRLYALEINLRKGGGSPPLTVLRNLVPGRYDSDTGTFHDAARRAKFYSASDNVVDEAWTGMAPADVIRAVGAAGLAFTPETGTGVVLHMLSGLAIDGRFGLTAIADSPEQAKMLHESTQASVDGMARAPTRPAGSR
jgi:hypothetical protein